MSSGVSDMSERDRENVSRLVTQLQKDAHQYCDGLIEGSKGKVSREAAWNTWVYARMAMMEIRLKGLEAITFYDEPEHSVYQFNPEDGDKTKPKE